MSAVTSNGSTGTPLVAVIAHVPILGEAVAAAMESIAQVRSFPSRGGTAGLLQWLRPDGVVVDTTEDAEAAAHYGRESHAPVVHVFLREARVRVLREDGWEEPDGEASAEEIRNILVGGMYGKGEQA